MKFLQHGDSVVSLRFKFQEVPGGNYEGAETVDDKLSFDTVGEIQDAMGELFESGEAPFNLQESVLDLDATRAAGDYTQAEMDNRLGQFQNNLNGALTNNGEFPDISDFMEALQEFMNQADDLGEFKEETSLLQKEVDQYAERVDASADARMEMAELADLVTAEGLSRDAKLTETGERTPDRPVMRVASTVEQLPTKLDEVLATLDDETAGRFGNSAMAGFDPDQFA